MVNNEIIKLKFDNSFNGRLFAVQGDTGRVFNLQVFDDFSKPVDVTGMKLRMYVANSKEVSYSEGEIVEAAEGKIKVQVYNSQLKYPGKQKAQFILTDKDGQKIGSKIFDLWIEEGLEAGPTVGRNIYVDFDKINEALDLIKDYDKSLEEAREVDASLKVGITEGIEARNNLADCKKKALEIKEQLDNSKVSANKTLDDLNKTKAEFETLKSNLSSENQKATTNISTLSEKIEEGKTTTSELNKSITNAKTNKSNLDKSNTTALATKKLLEDATTAAKTTETDLSNLKNNGDTLYQNLSTKITEGSNLKSNLDRSVSNAANSKSNLDESIANATSTNTTLKVTNTEAQKTEALIKDLMSQLGKTENEVKQIIASGDLSKYVTDPKLQEVLKNYATKADLSSIDVTDQLKDYAKTDELEEIIQQQTMTIKNNYQELFNLIGEYPCKEWEFMKHRRPRGFKPLEQLKEDGVYCSNGFEITIEDEHNKVLLSSSNDRVFVLVKTRGKQIFQYAFILNQNGIDVVHRNLTHDYTQWEPWEIISYPSSVLQQITTQLQKYETEIPTKTSQLENDTDFKTGAEIETIMNNKVDKVSGKQLSTNDFTNAHKAKVDAIPENPKYTDTIQDLSEYATKEDLKNIDNLKGFARKEELPRAATFVIANYDSSVNSKKSADYIVKDNECAGKIINDYIIKLPQYGGKIQLTEGIFNITSNTIITLNKDNIVIDGFGDATMINAKLEKQEKVIVVNSDNCQIKNLKINSISLNTIVLSGNNHRVENINIKNNNPNLDSMLVDSVKTEEKSNNIIIEKCTVDVKAGGSFLIYGTNNRLLNCTAISHNGVAFSIEGTNQQVLNCIGDATKGAYTLFCENSQIINCVGRSLNTQGFFLKFAKNSIITNNMYRSGNGKSIDDTENRGSNNLIKDNIKIK
ncbi:BppU family phage baseplate upper protein [uncultured Peptoniphilus sp.]|uniref:BppU family phage baseplate upper protein n=1 Tax=uncultured Peptoniphilus sp. TaxID=254354 RepID=UPI0028058ADC|nr:BppU family phage baseplate upper protein [uncultured Peptoniphilus sp.]